MKSMILKFKEPKLEQQFHNDRSEEGLLLIRVFSIAVLLEGLIALLDYLIDQKMKDLKVAGLCLAQLLVSMFSLLLGSRYLRNKFNLVICCQNIIQAGINCLCIDMILSPSEQFYLTNYFYSANIIFKHAYLLIGSSFIVKALTLINITLVYFFNLSQLYEQPGTLRHFVTSFLVGVCLFAFRILKQEKALRKHFLTSKSEEEMNFLVKKLLPVSMLITKYDSQCDRMSYHMANGKLQKIFPIKDDETMKEFLMGIQLQPLDSYQHHILSNTAHQSLFQHLHFQAKQQRKRKSQEANEKEQFTNLYSNDNTNNCNPLLVNMATNNLNNNSEVARLSINYQNQQSTSYKNSPMNPQKSSKQQRKIADLKNKKNSLNNNNNAKLNLSQGSSGLNNLKNLLESNESNSNLFNNLHNFSQLNDATNSDTFRPFNLQNFHHSRQESQNYNGCIQNALAVNSSNRGQSQSISQTQQLAKQINFTEQQQNTGISFDQARSRQQSVAQDGEEPGSAKNRIRIIRKKEHKRTLIKQFENLTMQDLAIDMKDTYRGRGNGNNGNANSQNSIEDISDEVFNRLDVVKGIFQRNNKPVVLNIKIYSFILEQIIIFEEETLQSKVNYLQKLNRYYTKLFDCMLKKMRLPIAHSLLKTKKAIGNIIDLANTADPPINKNNSGDKELNRTRNIINREFKRKDGISNYQLDSKGTIEQRQLSENRLSQTEENKTNNNENNSLEGISQREDDWKQEEQHDHENMNNKKRKKKFQNLNLTKNSSDGCSQNSIDSSNNQKPLTETGSDDCGTLSNNNSTCNQNNMEIEENDKVNEILDSQSDKSKGENQLNQDYSKKNKFQKYEKEDLNENEALAPTSIEPFKKRNKQQAKNQKHQQSGTIKFNGQQSTKTLQNQQNSQDQLAIKSKYIGDNTIYQNQQPTQQDRQQRKELIAEAQSMFYSNYIVLNTLYNFQDVFRIFQDNPISINPTNMNIQRLIADLKKIFQSEYTRQKLDLYFMAELTEEQQYINQDEKYLKQLLINLISNSLQTLKKRDNGYTVVHFKMNRSNDEVIDISILDTGPGIDEEDDLHDKIELKCLNQASLDKNLSVKDLRVGIPVSLKIVGKIGPFEKLIIDGNVVRFQIFRDYSSLLMQNTSIPLDRKNRKSVFMPKRTSFEEEADVEAYNNEIEEDKSQIVDAVMKIQMTKRNNINDTHRHSDYFIQSSWQ